MNKMSYLEATIPAGKECLFPSELEARQHFARLGLFGDISCGIVTTDCGEKDLAWLLKTEDNQFYPLQIFAREKEHQGKVTSFHQEVAGNYIGCDWHLYLLCQDDYLGLTIRELAIYSNQEDINALYRMDNISYESIFLVKTFSIVPVRKFMFVSWLIDRSDHTGEFKPAFIEDLVLHYGFDPTNLSWEIMNAGDTFMHFDEKYRVEYDKKTGWYFSKAFVNPHMKILKKAI